MWPQTISLLPYPGLKAGAMHVLGIPLECLIANLPPPCFGEGSGVGLKAGAM